MIDLLGILPYFMSLLLSMSLSGKIKTSLIHQQILTNNSPRREFGRGRGLRPSGNEAHRPDIPHHAHPEDLQAGQAHHGSADTGHDAEK